MAFAYGAHALSDLLAYVPLHRTPQVVREAAQRFLGHGDCFVEAGDRMAAIGSTDLYGDPSP